MLRKRSLRNWQSVKTEHHHNHDYGSYSEKKSTRRHYPYIRNALIAFFQLIILFKVLLYFKPSWNTINNNEDVINLKSIEILSTVPLGFALDLPKTLGSLEIYLDSQLISSIDDTASLSERHEHEHGTFNFGTCDIADHGDDDLKHAFSLGQGVLGNMKSILLKPGNHIIEIQQRKETQLIPYAQLPLKVESPPELILGSNPFSSSPYENSYKLALKEIGQNIACNHFVAGTGWSQLWTRDTSFAAELGAALIHPQVVQKSLMASVEVWENGENVWLQDKCGHFGGWPNLSDAIVGVRGAWSLYLVNGDKE